MNTLSYQRVDHTVRETGQEIRRALRGAFPGVKFGLRGSRGTGYGWFSLSWTDGPTTSQVDDITNGFRSSYFDGMDDSTHSIPATLYAREDGSLYEPHWSCNGVNTQRDYSPEAAAWARSYVDAHGGPETFCGGYHATHEAAARRIFSGVDMTGVDWASLPAVAPGHSGRHVPNSYCVETGVSLYAEHAPTHRAKVAQ